jgi:hypothetical protein
LDDCSRDADTFKKHLVGLTDDAKGTIKLLPAEELNLGFEEVLDALSCGFCE